MRKFCVLIGNGINNIGKDHTWENLISEIEAFCGININIDNEKKKHFPLLYEELFLCAARRNNKRESELKKFIASKVSSIQSNDLHRKILSLKTHDIITTNYEFSLEGAVPEKNNGIINERLYSIFRYFKVDDKKVWHIHGDCLHPNSINLGFEHYGGQLQHIRSYATTGPNYQSKKIDKTPLIKRLETNKISGISWIDLFFTTDVHIVGLTLGYVESDLWWLLTYRARKKIEKKNLITNNITYYIPKKYSKDVKNKLDLLNATDVTVVTIDKTDENYYNEIFERLK